jgi:hypothetical protein
MASLGAFGEPGDNQGASGPNYLVARGETAGWNATPLDPPAEMFENSGRLNLAREDMSQDFSRALYAEYPASSKPVDLRYYVRQANGSFAEVGPTVPSKAVEEWVPGSTTPSVFYVGASRDLTHVLFTSGSGTTATPFLWPGDTTIIGESLYEYVGTGHTGTGTDVPALVGVDNERHLISQCGTFLGSAVENLAGANSLNAISADGSTVFFTALKGGCKRNAKEVGAGPLVNELYARIGGSHTVGVSEPAPTDCAACKTGPGERKPPKFQGASGDGSKVLFLSEQELLQGATGQSLYEYDFNAANSSEKVTLIASQVLGVSAVSANAGVVYLVSGAILAGNEDAKKQKAQAGFPNLYAYDTGSRQAVFITTLSLADSAGWAVEGNRPNEVTPDGRFLLFTSTNDLTPDAVGGGAQLYRYDIRERQLVRISIGERGFHDNEGASFTIASPNYTTSSAATQAVSISDDGAYVFFQSPEALTPQALNNVPLPRGFGVAYNVYEYHDGHVSLISDGRDSHEGLGTISTVALVGASPSGADVFFTTADPLVAQDTDTQLDIYDARIGGGFPTPATAQPCPSECQGTLSGTPLLPSAASATLAAEGGLTPPGAATSGQPKPKALTRAEKLARALRACRKRPKAERRACVKRAERQYGTKSKKARSSLRRYQGGK